jgi:hypothetical protein
MAHSSIDLKRSGAPIRDLLITYFTWLGTPNWLTASHFLQTFGG